MKDGLWKSVGGISDSDEYEIQESEIVTRKII